MVDPIAIEADVLSRAMKHAAGIVMSSVTIPVLANVRMLADGDWLEIATSDLDTEYCQRLPLRTPGQIATTVDAKRLAAMAAAAPNGAQMSFELIDSRLTIKAGRSRWLLPVLDASEFPAMPVQDIANPIEVPGKSLAEAIGRCAWAASTVISQPWLMGVYWSDEAGKLRIAASDSNAVLAAVTTDMPWPGEAEHIIVPSKFAATLERLTAEAGHVTLAWNDRLLRASFGDTVLTGKLIEGPKDFPDYRRLFAHTAEQAAQTDAGALVDPAMLRSALRRIELVGSEKTRAVRMICRQDLIELGMVSPVGGQGNEETPANCGERQDTGLDGRLLGAMLEAIGGDTISIHQAEPGSPALFRRVVDDGMLGIVMPMRI